MTKLERATQKLITEAVRMAHMYESAASNEGQLKLPASGARHNCGLCREQAKQLLAAVKDLEALQ